MKSKSIHLNLLSLHLQAFEELEWQGGKLQSDFLNTCVLLLCTQCAPLWLWLFIQRE